MRRYWKNPLFIHVALFFSIVSFADAAVPSGWDLELYPTYHAVSATLRYQGDTDKDATAILEYRINGGAWTRGIQPVRLMAADLQTSLSYVSQWATDTRNAWTGSIYPLDPGTMVDVRIIVTDPDGSGSGTGDGQVRTLVLPTNGPGATWYVATNGSDSANGSASVPFRTINHALSQAACGDTVLVGAGLYKERLVFTQQCTFDKPLIVRRSGTTRPIIDNGVSLPKGSGGWTQHGTTGVWRRDVTVPEDKPVRILVIDGKRAMRYVTLANLESDPTNWDHGRAFYEERINATKRRIYVRTMEKNSPDLHDLHYAVVLAEPDYPDQIKHSDNRGVLFQGSKYVILDGFEVRHSGGPGVYFTGRAFRNGLLHSVVHHNNVDIRMESGEQNAIWNNEAHELGVEAFVWRSFYNAATDHAYMFVPVFVRGGRGNSLVANDVHHSWDGIMGSPPDTDKFFNKLWDNVDDAFELDGYTVHNRVHGNNIRNGLVAFSLAPIRVGPLYITRNTATYQLYLFKTQGGTPIDDDGYVFGLHNSGYALSQCASPNGIRSPAVNAEVIFGNKRYQNNAIHYAGYADVLRSEMVVDYNAYAGTRADAFNYGGFKTIQQLRASSPFEKNGFHASEKSVSNLGWTGMAGFGSMPCFSEVGVYRMDDFSGHVNPWQGVDFTPLSSSILRDRGVAASGVNAVFSGTAPDIGAIEYGGSATPPPPPSYSSFYPSFSPSVTPPPPSSAPVITNVKATVTGETTARITWDVSEPATGQTEYGLTTSYGYFSKLEATFNYSSHGQNLSGLMPGTLYHFRVHSTNQAGIKASSGDYTFVTLGGTSLSGDLNSDGQVNALDLQLEVNVILGTEPNTTVRVRADLNGDGAVNALDLQRLVNVVLGV